VLLCSVEGGPSSIGGVGDPWVITEEVIGGFDADVITSELTGFHCILNSEEKNIQDFKTCHKVHKISTTFFFFIKKDGYSIDMQLLTNK
jgi:hypothetical protein